MTGEERAACNQFIKEYIVRKQAQDEWDPSNAVLLMRVGFKGGLEYERVRSRKLFDAVLALWGALKHFTAEELDPKPDEFHELIQSANDYLSDFRADTYGDEVDRD